MCHRKDVAAQRMILSAYVSKIHIRPRSLSTCTQLLSPCTIITFSFRKLQEPIQQHYV
jgi:hypothetical protein